MGSNCLILLYTSVLVPIFSDWIDVASLSRLDVAICSSSCRSHFLHVLAKCHVGFEGSISPDKSIFDWLWHRELTVTDYKCCGEPTAVEVSVLQRTRCFQNLVGHTDILLSFLDRCDAISLWLFGSDEDCARAVLSKLFNLTSLRIDCGLTKTLSEADFPSFCHLKKLSAWSNVAVLVEFCKGLTEIEVPYSVDVVNAISHLPSVTAVHFRANGDRSQKTADLMPIAEYCSQLRVLDLSYTFVRDDFVCRLAVGCPGLTDLYLSRSLISDAGLIALSSLPLVSFGVHARITDEGLMMFAEKLKPTLTKLDISYCPRLHDASILYILVHCRQLTYLDLAKTPFSDLTIVRAFHFCPGLTELLLGESDSLNPLLAASFVYDMERVNVHFSRIEVFHSANDPSTKRVIGAMDMNYDKASFRMMFMQCPRLTEVSIDNTGMNLEMVQLMVVHCPLLTNVSLYSCGNVHLDSAMYLLNSNLNLRELCLGVESEEYLNEYEYDTSNLLMTKTLETLSHLRIECLIKLSDAMLASIAQHCPNLELLYIPGCMSITSIGATSVLKHCQRLTTFDLGSTSVDAGVFQVVIEVNRQLLELDVTECSQITKTDVAKYFSAVKSLMRKLIV